MMVVAVAVVGGVGVVSIPDFYPITVLQGESYALPPPRKRRT